MTGKIAVAIVEGKIALYKELGKRADSDHGPTGGQSCYAAVKALTEVRKDLLKADRKTPRPQEEPPVKLRKAKAEKAQAG